MEYLRLLRQMVLTKGMKARQQKSEFSTAKRLHYSCYPSRVRFSRTLTNFARAQTAYSVGLSTGKSLARHGCGKSFTLQKCIRAEPFFFLVRILSLSEPRQRFSVA